MIARILRIASLAELLVAASLAHALFWWSDWPLAAALAAGLATPLALHAAIVATTFALSRALRGPAPVGSGLSPAASLRLFAREFADSVVVFQFAQPWLALGRLAGEDRRRWVDGEPLPVLLVHGYLCNRQLWRKAAARLAGAGHAIGAVDLEPAWGSIDGYAPAISEAVERLRSRTGAPKVALVCHSMGGLAARAWLRAAGEAALAATAAVVTIGTPHRGTLKARFGYGRNARQMEVGSEWLEDLAAGEDARALALFRVILSHHDNVVVSRERQTLPGAETVEFDGIGHLSLARDARVLDAVLRALAGAR